MAVRTKPVITKGELWSKVSPETRRETRVMTERFDRSQPEVEPTAIEQLYSSLECRFKGTPDFTATRTEDGAFRIKKVSVLDSVLGRVMYLDEPVIYRPDLTITYSPISTGPADGRPVALFSGESDAGEFMVGMFKDELEDQAKNCVQIIDTAYRRHVQAQRNS